MLNIFQNKQYSPLSPGQNSELFPLFSFVFGFYLIIHMPLVAEITSSPISKFFMFIPALMGIVLMLKPQSVTLFIVAVIISYIDTWVALPGLSNSTFLTLMIETYIIVSYLAICWRQKSFRVNGSDLLHNFAPGGRLALLTMYFFGIFQKLNTDFFDHNVSCAATMVQYFHGILPSTLTEHSIVLDMAIYGTLIIEGLVMILLITPRYRYAGVVIGMGFHFMLSMNSFNYFQPFSTLAFLMHILFLEPQTLKRWQSSVIGQFFTKSTFRHRTVTFLFCMLWLSVIILWFKGYNPPIYLLWFPVGLSYWLFVICYGQKVNQQPSHFFFSETKLINVLSILFFLQCFSPYIGLKTQQTINMFSNLRTEDGISNHLIISKPFYLFNYQKDLVTIINSNDSRLNWVKKHEHKFIAMDFFNYIARNPTINVTYLHKGQEFTSLTRTEDEIKKWRLPFLVHKLMVWRTVPTAEKIDCLI